jgi:Fe-S oxidoreductase
MRTQNTSAKNYSTLRMRSALQEQLRAISEKCINCRLCQEECSFLREYGKPKAIADAYDPSDKAHQALPFKCSLCQLCAAVCPKDIDPAKMFLEMRREAVDQGNVTYPGHSRVLDYERRGTARRYTYYALPEACDTIFFPGCSLAGTRPDTTLRVYELMRKDIPTLGIVLDCCTKPSHDLGRDHHFAAMFDEMKNYLAENGVRKIIVACPSCYSIFANYAPELSIETVYERFAGNGFPKTKRVNGAVTIHDPCATRFEEAVHSSVRYLVTKQGLNVTDMPHHGKKALCCGEGGVAGCLAPDLPRNWRAVRKRETNGGRIVTYCAGCANLLGQTVPTSHILDLLFEPEATMADTVKVSKAPLTYLNRIKLKTRLRNVVAASVTRERPCVAVEQRKKRGMIRRIVSGLLKGRVT